MSEEDRASSPLLGGSRSLSPRNSTSEAHLLFDRRSREDPHHTIEIRQAEDGQWAATTSSNGNSNSTRELGRDEKHQYPSSLPLPSGYGGGRRRSSAGSSHLPPATKGLLASRFVQIGLLVVLVVLVSILVDGVKDSYRVVRDRSGPGLLLRPVQYTKSSSSIPAAPGFDGDALSSDVYPSFNNLCNICDCTTTPPSLPSSLFKPRRSMERSDLPTLVRNAILDVQCRQVYSTRNNAFVTVRDIVRDPSSALHWDLSRLEPHKPTSYLFTKTYPGSKTGAERAKYLDRHARTVHKFWSKMDKTWKGKYEDGTPARDRQIVWIIVEDDSNIDPKVAATLAEADISYIYFAFGPTRNFGNAQHNAALAMIHHLSNHETGLLGHGPIFSADDDAELHEDLLLYVWRIRRIGIWPMGNLGPTGFEGPIWSDEGKITGWSAGNSWRKYPVDNGAFTFNSTLLGHDLPGPAFWPTDTNGGETEFIEKLVKDKDDLEPVCKECHVAWHNHPLDIPHVGNNVYRPG